jgi:hypothetical protein
VIQERVIQAIICDDFSELEGKNIPLGTVVLETSSGQFDVTSKRSSDYWASIQQTKRTTAIPSGDAVATAPNEYAVTFDFPFTFTDRRRWDKMAITFDVTNTGPAVLKVDALDNKALKKTGAVALEVDDIIPGKIYFVIFDGTNYQII